MAPRRAPRAKQPLSDKPPRRRRDAAEARTSILDAAEQLLVTAGPSGIRLQDVAAVVGVSHPTVLHHFGSREALVDAVIARFFAALQSDLVATLQRSSGGVDQLRAILDAVAEALSRGGHGRVLLWLALSGHHQPHSHVRLAHVVDAAHALREKKRGPLPLPSRDDTAHVVVLAALSLVAATALGPHLLEDAGLQTGEAGLSTFRTWLARLLVTHLDSTPSEYTK